MHAKSRSGTTVAFAAVVVTTIIIVKTFSTIVSLLQRFQLSSRSNTLDCMNKKKLRVAGVEVPAILNLRMLMLRNHNKPAFNNNNLSQTTDK